MARTKAKKQAKPLPGVRPLDDKLLVRRSEAEDKTRGGIVLPDTAKEKPRQGTVLAAGTGKLLDDGSRAEFQVSVGDKIVFASYAGTEIEVKGEEYLLISESDVLAILD